MFQQCLSRSRSSFVRSLRDFVVFMLLSCFLNVQPATCSFDPFMDSDLFSIKWQGPLYLNEEEVRILGDRLVVITTNKHEKYECILPDNTKNAKDSDDDYVGPTPEGLMRPLFEQTQCSYRIESYWTYELCHGKHLKQYHETKEQGSQAKVQEYYLGFGNHREQDKSKDPSSETTKDEKALPVKELDGEELPYFEVIMTDGTKCDLTDTPRKTHIFYVCHPEGRGEVYELKESSTCEYEVLVLTAHLCKHPKYRPRRPPVNEVRCHALMGSPLKPTELLNVERETQVLSRAGEDFVIHQRQPQPPAPLAERGDSSQSQHKPPPKFHKKPSDFAVPSKPHSSSQTPPQENTLGAVTDKQTLRNFFKGHSCLRGGTGWWKHEICFGKYVRQFHIEQGRETSIQLGQWYKDKHLDWLQANPLKRPKDSASRKLVSLYYSGGDHCELSNKPRVCEVRLKCIVTSRNPHAVILSLVEPKPCEYILTVESALFCSVLNEADDFGLFDKVDL